MFFKQSSNVAHHRPYLDGIAFIAQTYHGMKPIFVTNRENLKIHICDLAVGQRNEGSIEGADPGGAQTDVFHRSDNVGNFQRVSHSHGLIGNERDTGDYVLECLLGGKSNGNAANTDSGECRRWVHAEVVKAKDKPGEED